MYHMYHRKVRLNILFIKKKYITYGSNPSASLHATTYSMYRMPCVSWKPHKYYDDRVDTIIGSSTTTTAAPSRGSTVHSIAVVERQQ